MILTKHYFAAFLGVLFLCSFLCVPAVAAPELSAVSAILVDGDTGRVLFEKNADEERLIASITKLMTALVVVEAMPKLDTLVTIERADTLAEGSSMYLKIGEEVPVETLLYGLLLSSGNDAALAVARHCAGDVETFVSWMNQRAVALGMEHSHFANPNGLNDEQHYSTARDMAKLAMEVMKNETLAQIVGTKSITLGTRSFSNHNKLLWQYEGCVGMKTGYTERAGRTLVSCARREGQPLIAVTLCDPNDWADHAALLDYGFETYPRSVLATAEQELRSLAVAGSLVRFVTVYTATDVFYPTQTGEVITAKIDLPEQVKAPITAGEIAGSMTFYLKGEEIGRSYLVYGASVRSNVIVSNSLLKKVINFFGRDSHETFLSTFYAENSIS